MKRGAKDLKKGKREFGRESNRSSCQHWAEKNVKKKRSAIKKEEGGNE